MILSLGEALIDLIHGPDGAEPRAQVGGSPFNVSIALSRMEIEAGFLCPISEDAYGEMLASSLESNGVELCVKTRTSEPTAIAEVRTDAAGHPSYVFHREGTADRALAKYPPAEALPRKIEALHFGSLVLAQEQDWPAWKEAIVRAKERGAFIAFDPNLRVLLIDDLDRYRERLVEAVALADLIKASDEDLSLLVPGCDPEEQIQSWCSPERLVVLTQGSLGARLWARDGEVLFAPAEAGAQIVDTVGAGDTFQAAILAWLSHHSGFNRSLEAAEAEELLAFANRAALLNCTKAGCQPPTLKEIS